MTALAELKQLAEITPHAKQVPARPQIEITNVHKLRPDPPRDYTKAIESLRAELASLSKGLGTMVQGFNLIAKALAEQENQVSVNIDLDPLREAVEANTKAIKGLEEAQRAKRQITFKDGKPVGLKVG